MREGEKISGLCQVLMMSVCLLSLCSHGDGLLVAWVDRLTDGVIDRWMDWLVDRFEYLCSGEKIDICFIKGCAARWTEREDE